MAQANIKGLFGQPNTNEAKLISSLHNERINLSGNNVVWYILNIAKTMGEFDASDYESDSYDFLYNEEIIKIGRSGRIYMPGVQLPCIAITPTFEQQQNIIQIQTEEKIEIEVNLRGVLELVESLKYSELFFLTNLTEKNYKLKIDYKNSKILILENDNIIAEFTNNFSELYNYFLQHKDEFYLENVYSKSTLIADLKAPGQQEEIIIPLNIMERNKIQINDNDFWDLEIIKQKIPKIGDIVKTYTNKFYEIMEVYPIGIALWEYMALKIIAKKVSLYNVDIKEEDFTNYIQNFSNKVF